MILKKRHTLQSFFASGLFNYESKIIKLLLFFSSFAVIITLTTIMLIFGEASKFFTTVPLLNFLTGMHWDPQIDNSPELYKTHFGAIPVFLGTLFITFLALIFAAPIGILSASYLTEYASKKFRNHIKPTLEMLASVPTVVYGYFAAIYVGPFIRRVGEHFGMQVASESALAAGLVMGVMITPFILSLCDDAFNAVPQNLRDASLALGATKAETTLKVVLPTAFSGVLGAVLLAVSRCIGETMIVTMAAGLTAKLTLNPLDSVTTVTAQIVSLLMGDQEFDSPKTLAAFALALILFLVTFLLNFVAITAINNYKKSYK